MLSLDHLRQLTADGTIDTVVLAFTDMQGRLQGKRLSAEFFLAEVVENHAEGCNYLLAVDVEMNTVDGYAMSSWIGRTESPIDQSSLPSLVGSGRAPK